MGTQISTAMILERTELSIIKITASPRKHQLSEVAVSNEFCNPPSNTCLSSVFLLAAVFREEPIC